jgi:hypothetical protein
MVDDIDNDGLVELVIIGEANDVFVWDFPASYDGGRNKARLYEDNANSGVYAPPGAGTALSGKGY